MKILIIEDNPRLADRIKQQLSKWYIVEIAESGDKGLQFVATHLFDIALLDLGLPDTPGIDVCKQIRKLSQDLPILVLTGVDTIESRVYLLENGADDYMTKPFEVAELRARINALARRRTRSEQSPTIVVGDVTIDPARRLVTRNGTEVHLRRKEFDILEYLASHPGRVMSRQNIIDHAWSSTSTSWSGSVDVHIKQLRDKIDKPFAYPLIKTSYGLGYMIEAPENSTEKTAPH